MKKLMKFLAAMCFAAGITAQLLAQGYFVPNGVTYGGYSPSFGSTIRVLQNPTNGDYTGFSLVEQSANTFLFDPFADEGVRTFFVSLNDPISLQAIQTAGYAELLYPNSYAFNDGVPVYVGLYTGYNPQSGIYENPMFGWAQLVNNAGVIELLDGALAYNSAGIFAGTLNIIQVPEPSAFTLVCLGLLSLSWHLWRKVGDDWNS